MNLSTFLQFAFFLTVWLTISLSKLTGVYLIVWLFSPRIPYSNNTPRWVFLWSPIVEETEEGFPKIYWLGWILSHEGMTGSSSETCDSWVNYDTSTFYRGESPYKINVEENQ